MASKPGDYPVGSPKSRAAARTLLEAQRAGRRRVDIVSSIPRPDAEDAIRIGTWIELPDRSLFRLSNIPAGMTIAEAEQIVSQSGRKSTPQT